MMRKYTEDAKPKILNRERFTSPKKDGRSSLSGDYYNGHYVIYSYSTPIAVWNEDASLWYITRRRYSVTTSTQQSALKQILWDQGIVYFDAEISELGLGII